MNEQPIVTTLPNGLRVATLALPEARVAQVELYIGVGASHEAAPAAGITHMDEHAIFLGAAGWSEIDLIRAHDALGGMFNAETSPEYTRHYATVLPEDALEAMRLHALPVLSPLYPQVEFEREKRVIVHEILEEREDPDSISYEALYAAAFGESPMGRSIAGNEETIRSFSRENVASWHHAAHGPNNMMVVAAGLVHHQQIVDEAERLFGHLPVMAPLERYGSAYVGGRAFRRQSLEQLRLSVGFCGVPHYHKHECALELASIILAGNQSSRLHQEVRMKHGASYYLHADNVQYADTGMFSLHASIDPKDAEKVLGIFFDQMRALPHSITLQEVEWAKRSVLLSLADSGFCVADYAMLLGECLILGDRYISLDESMRAYRAVTLEEVRDACAQLLTQPVTVTGVGVTRHLERALERTFGQSQHAMMVA